MVPHVVRLTYGPLHRRLLPLTALGGAILLVSPTRSRVRWCSGQEIPIGVVTAVHRCAGVRMVAATRVEGRMRVDIDDVGWDVGEVTIIDAVTASISPGSFTGLIGPNGSGKTTLLHVLAGLRRPARGMVAVDGEDVHRLPGRSALAGSRCSSSTPSPRWTCRPAGRRARQGPHRGRWPGQQAAGTTRSSVRCGSAGSTTSRIGDGRPCPVESDNGLSSRGRSRRALAVDARRADQPPRPRTPDRLPRHRPRTGGHHDRGVARPRSRRCILRSPRRAQGRRIVAAGPVDQVLTSDLIQDVYSVRTTVERHASAGRLNVVWHR